MKPKYLLAIAAQGATYAFLALAVLVVIGATDWLLFIATPPLILFGCITPLFLNCERCGVTYFWSRRQAEKAQGGMNLRPGYNLLLPLKAHCPKCGLNRRD